MYEQNTHLQKIHGDPFARVIDGSSDKNSLVSFRASPSATDPPRLPTLRLSFARRRTRRFVSYRGSSFARASTLRDPLPFSAVRPEVEFRPRARVVTGRRPERFAYYPSRGTARFSNVTRHDPSSLRSPKLAIFFNRPPGSRGADRTDTPVVVAPTTTRPQQVSRTEICSRRIEYSSRGNETKLFFRFIFVRIKTIIAIDDYSNSSEFIRLFTNLKLS